MAGNRNARVGALVRREFLLLLSRRGAFLTMTIFFVEIGALFAFGLDPEPGILREVGLAALPVAALLSSLLTSDLMFGDDYRDGTLVELLLLPFPPLGVVYAKVLAHGLATALALSVLGPLLALQYRLDAGAALRASLVMWLLMPSLSSLGAFASALTLGLKNGSFLPALIHLPLAVPLLVFSSRAIEGADKAPWYLLASLALGLLFFLPMATAALLRWTVD